MEKKKLHDPLTVTADEVHAMVDEDFTQLIQDAERISDKSKRENVIEKLIMIRYKIIEVSDPEEQRKLAQKVLGEIFTKLKKENDK